MRALLVQGPSPRSPALYTNDQLAPRSVYIGSIEGHSHLGNYRGELQALMTETFHIIDRQDIPVQYREVA